MAWTLEYDPRAVKDLNRLHKNIRKEIVSYLEERVIKASDPAQFGKALTADKKGLWRYRWRDYRIVCRLQRQRLVVLVVGVGHRSIVYDD